MVFASTETVFNTLLKVTFEAANAFDIIICMSRQESTKRISRPIQRIGIAASYKRLMPYKLQNNMVAILFNRPESVRWRKKRQANRPMIK